MRYMCKYCIVSIVI